jgi:hypothetical protein
MFQKEGENLERLLLQFDSNAVLAQFGGAQVYFEEAKTPGSNRTLNRSHRHSPLQCAERSMQRWGNQYSLYLAGGQAVRNLEAVAILGVCAMPV